MHIQVPIRLLGSLSGLCLGATPAPAQGDFCELPPILYSETVSTDALTLIARRWEDGTVERPAGAPRDVLRTLLKQLDVPEDSQVLVFSRTSKQSDLIRYENPRAVYYSEDTYVGYVPGGHIEIAATDPVLGPVFYHLDMHKVGEAGFVERDNTCLQCHATSRTELVPGLLVRSVFPDENGHPILAAGTYLTTHASPFKERWGGWYVTGHHGDLRHMGNTLAARREGDARTDFDYDAGANWETLEGKIDTTKYLRPTSDIVSLMILEHQCKLQNLFTKAGMEYRRLAFLQRAIDPEADLGDPGGMAARSVRDSADELVRAMLFCDEFGLGDGVEGDPRFVEAFEGRGPRTKEGHSLRELRLYGRMFKNRCSYMIYSTAFESLPPAVKKAVLGNLWDALGGEKKKDFSHLGASERARIIAIVRETVPGLPECWL